MSLKQRLLGCLTVDDKETEWKLLDTVRTLNEMVEALNEIVGEAELKLMSVTVSKISYEITVGIKPYQFTAFCVTADVLHVYPIVVQRVLQGADTSLWQAGIPKEVKSKEELEDALLSGFDGVELKRLLAAVKVNVARECPRGKMDSIYLLSLPEVRKFGYSPSNEPEAWKITPLNVLGEMGIGPYCGVDSCWKCKGMFTTGEGVCISIAPSNNEYYHLCKACAFNDMRRAIELLEEGKKQILMKTGVVNLLPS